VKVHFAQLFGRKQNGNEAGRQKSKNKNANKDVREKRWIVLK
jgi:hypothetical protein